MSTTSYSNLENNNHIIYDTNNMFGILNIQDTPSNSQEYFSINLLKTGGNLINSVQTVTLSFQIKQQMDQGMVLEIQLQDNFLINSCTSNSLTNNQFLCSINETQNTIYIAINKNIAVNDSFSTTLEIKVPMYPVVKTYYSVGIFQQKDFKKYGQVLQNKLNQEFVGMTADIIPVSSFKVTNFYDDNFIINDTEITDRTHPQFLYETDNGLYHQNNYTPTVIAASVKYDVYNNLKFIYQLGNDTPDLPSLQANAVKIRVQNSNIIEGSIDTNLPSLNEDNQVFCRYEEDDFNNKYDIVCINVGNLIQNQDYYLAVRVQFYSDHQFTVKNSENFGLLTIFHHNLDTNKTFIKNSKICQGKYYRLSQNIFNISRSPLNAITQALWQQTTVFSSTDISTTADPFSLIKNGSRQGIMDQNTDNSLLLLYNTEYGDDENIICSYLENDCTNVDRELVLTVYFNTNVITRQNNLKIINTDNSGNGVVDDTIQSINTVNSQKLRYNSSNSATNQELSDYKKNSVGYDADFSSTSLHFLYLEDVIQTGSQFVHSKYQAGNERSYDFVIGFTSGLQQDCTTACQDPASYNVAESMVLHGFTFSSNVSFYTSTFERFNNYMTDNKGSEFATYYQIRGQFSSLPSGYQKIAVFFDASVSLDFFGDVSDQDPYSHNNLDSNNINNSYRMNNYHSCNFNNKFSITQNTLGVNQLNRNQCFSYKTKHFDDTDEGNQNYLFGSMLLVNFNSYTINNFIDLIIPVQTKTSLPMVINLAILDQNNNILKNIKFGQLNIANMQAVNNNLPDLITTTSEFSRYVLGTLDTTGDCITNISTNDWTINGSQQQFDLLLDEAADLKNIGKSYAFSSPIILRQDLFSQLEWKVFTTLYTCYKLVYREIHTLNQFNNIICELHSGTVTSIPATYDLNGLVRNSNDYMSYEQTLNYAVNLGENQNDQVFGIINECKGNQALQPKNSVSYQPTITINSEVEQNHKQKQSFSIQIEFTNGSFSQNLQVLKDQQIIILFTLTSGNWETHFKNNFDQYCMVKNFNCYVQTPQAASNELLLNLKSNMNQDLENININFLSMQNLSAGLNIQSTVQVFYQIGDYTKHYFFNASQQFVFLSTRTKTSSDEVLTINGLQFQKSKKSSISEFDLSMDISANDQGFTENDYIFLDLKWLGYDQNSNLQCYILKDNAISSEWNEIQIQKTSILLKTYSSFTTASQYTLHCDNYIVPKWLYTEQLNIEWKQYSDLVVQATNIPQIIDQNFSDNSNTFTLPSTSINSNIQIKFPFVINDNLNNIKGVPDCYINQYLNYCEIINKQTIQLTLYQKYSTNEIIELKISGVTQPINQQQGIIQVFIGSNYQIIQDINAQEPVQNINYVLSQSTNNQNIRVTGTHNIQFELPYLGINKDIPLIIEYLQSSPQSYINTPTCQITRINDANNFDWVESCKFIDSQKLQVNMKYSDGNSTDSNISIYSIQIQNGIQPVCYNEIKAPIQNQSFKIIVPSDKQLLNIRSISIPKNQQQEIEFTSQNTKIDLQWKGVSNSIQNQNQIWDCLKTIIVYKGYMVQQIGLYPIINNINDQTLFTEEFNVIVSNDSQYKNLFVLSNNIISIESGKSSSNLINIGATQSANVGMYYLEMNRQNINNFSKYVQSIPMLNIQISEQKCSSILTTPQTGQTIRAPIDGLSIPIVIDFVNCFPVEEVTVKGSIASGSDGVQYYELQNKQQTIYNEGDLSNSKLVFYVKCINQNVVNDASFNLNFSITGKNGDSYNFSGIQYIVKAFKQDASLGTPEIQALSADQGQNNSNQLVIQTECTMEGQVFYGVYYNKSPSSYTLQYIQSLTKDKLRNTYIQGDNTDIDKWAIFGYDLTVSSGNVFRSTINVNNLRYGQSYKVQAYCVNIQNTQSLPSYIQNRSIVRGNGNVQRLKFQFDKVLTTLQKQFLACAVYKTIPINSSRVQTDEILNCNTEILQQFENEISTALENTRLLKQNEQDQYQQNQGENRQLLVTQTKVNLNGKARSDRLYTYIYIINDEYIFDDTQLNTRIEELKNLNNYQSIVTDALPGNFPTITGSVTFDSINNVSIYDDQILPNIDYNVSDFELLGNQLDLILKLNNPGFLIMAILKLGDSRVGANITTQNLINNPDMFTFHYVDMIESSEDKRTFSLKLEDSQIYTMYWLAVDENPSKYATTSTVYETNFITVPYTEYNYTFSNRIQFYLFSITCIIGLLI